MHPAQPGDADNIPGIETDPAEPQPETANTAEPKGCLVYGIAVLALLAAIGSGGSVVGLIVDVWTGRARVGSVVLSGGSALFFGLQAARIAMSFGLALDRFRNVKGWLSAASYCVLFAAGPLALLLYGADLWWTGHAPDRAGGIASSLITGLLIGVAAGAAITKHRSKDTTGRV